MGFSLDSVTQLMHLVDENKDDIKEATYVEICNAMKFLYDKKRSESVSRPTPPVHTPPPSENNRFYLDAERRSYHTREQLEQMLIVTRNRLANVRMRVDNSLKTRALRLKCRAINIPELETVRGAYTNVEVKRVEDMIIATGVSAASIKTYYQTFKQQLVGRERILIANRIRHLENCIQQIGV